MTARSGLSKKTPFTKRRVQTASSSYHLVLTRKVLLLLLAHRLALLKASNKECTQPLPWPLLKLIPVTVLRSARVQHTVKVRLRFNIVRQRSHKWRKSAREKFLLVNFSISLYAEGCASAPIQDFFCRLYEQHYFCIFTKESKGEMVFSQSSY